MNIKEFLRQAKFRICFGVTKDMNKVYSFAGTVYLPDYRKMSVPEEERLYTTAPTLNRAVNNLEFKAMKKLGLSRNERITIQPWDIRQEEVKEKVYWDNHIDKGKCPICGYQLNDQGECPVCDLGEEDLLESNIAFRYLNNIED